MKEPTPLRPDDVLTPDGRRLPSEQRLRDGVLLIPRLAKLVIRLIADPRVPRRSKVALAVAAAYVVSPLDLISDVLPPFKWADEFLVLMFALDNLMRRAGPEIVAEHWDGPGNTLSLIQELVGLSRLVLPRRVSLVMEQLTG